MSEPLKPHEVVAHAALTVADPEAEMRKELRKMLAEIVKLEVDSYFSPNNMNASVFASNVVHNQKYTIGLIAKAAIKDHFNNPTQITSV